MISICIPVYNFNVTNLVKNLSDLVKILDVSSEIVLIDDCSNDYFKKANEMVCKQEVYIQLEKNVGRAAIRNRFLKYAKYEYLLFLDCDTSSFSNDFLCNYIPIIKKHPKNIIYGGSIYQKNPPKRNKRLRWKYGIKKESKPSEIRKLRPYKSFMTNNFVIGKSIFQQIKFDESLVNYGYEDTLFGFELKKANIGLVHIDNPVVNGGLANNLDYIHNTELAIKNLSNVVEKVNYDKEFINDVTLLKTYYDFYKFRKIIIVIFTITKPVIKYLLSKGYVNLYLFDFYKLGTLSKIMGNKTQ